MPSRHGLSSRRHASGTCGPILRRLFLIPTRLLRSGKAVNTPPPRPLALEGYALDDWGRDLYGPRWRGTDPQGRTVTIRCRPSRGPEATRVASRLEALRIHEQTTYHLADLARQTGEEDMLAAEGDTLPADQRHFPRLLEVLDGGPGRQLLLLEWVQGVTLDQLMRGVPTLTRAELHTLARGLGEALQEWHDQGLAHGDLSPSNIVLSKEGEIILIDLFGSASERGTAPWAAPERLRGAPPSLASDVYSLAAILRACARGPAVSRCAEKLIMGCLEQDPAARPRIDRVLRRMSDLPEPEPLPLPEDESGALFSGGETWGEIDTLPTLPPERRSRQRRPAGERALLSDWPRAMWVGLSCLSLILAGRWGAHRFLTDGTQLTASEHHSHVSEEEDLLRQVIARRDQAFADADLNALAETVEPGSSLAARDAQSLQELQQAGARLEGLHTIIDEVEVLESGELYRFRLRTRQSEYRVLTSTGEQVMAEGATQELLITMLPATRRIVEIRAGEWS